MAPITTPLQRRSNRSGTSSLLFLLGDSGLGKSDVFLKEAAAINAEGAAEHVAMFCRVSDYISTQQIQTYFEGPPFQGWLSGTVSLSLSLSLSLFIDGFDEGLLRGDEWRASVRLQLEQWAEVLITPDGTEHGAIDRLRLRVSCRPGLSTCDLNRSEPIVLQMKTNERAFFKGRFAILLVF
jgi:hypothetical protein